MQLDTQILSSQFEEFWQMYMPVTICMQICNPYNFFTEIDNSITPNEFFFFLCNHTSLHTHCSR